MFLNTCYFSREKSREAFVEMRKHVMIKIELLDEKHVRELGLHLRSMMEALHAHSLVCTKILDEFAQNNFSSEAEESSSNIRRDFEENDLESDEQGEPLIST